MPPLSLSERNPLALVTTPSSGSALLRAIENFNEQFKTIFDGHAQVPTKGLLNTARFALGAVFVYQLALLYHHQHGQWDLRLGLRAFLKAA